MGDSKADQKMSLPMANKPQLYLRPNIAAAVDNGLLHIVYSSFHLMKYFCFLPFKSEGFLYKL